MRLQGQIVRTLYRGELWRSLAGLRGLRGCHTVQKSVRDYPVGEAEESPSVSPPASSSPLGFH